MKIWIERALAALRWGWDHIRHVSRLIGSKLVEIGNTIYDPPPVAYKRLFFTGLAIFVAGGLTFAFANSWFYRPTVEFFATLGDDGDVFIPDHIEPLPSVATPAVTVPSVEVVCHDMSDTPQCEPVKDLTPEVIPPPVAKPKATHYRLKRVRKHQPYVTYWGY